MMEQMGIQDDNMIKEGTLSTSKHRMNAKSQYQMEITNAVFNNPLLMDIIVKYSIHKSNGKRSDNTTINTVRTVNKTWLQSATRVLKASGRPVILLIVGLQSGKNTVNNVAYDKQKGNILDQFVSVFSMKYRAHDSFLPIYFALEQFYLKKECCENLRNFFEKCSDIIIGMSVMYPLDGGALNLKFSNLNFPALRNFEFKFKTWKDPITLEPISPISGSHANGLKLLVQVLQNSNKLLQFSLKKHEEAGVKLSGISLPEALTGVTLSRPITNEALTLLTKNPMPKLTYLDLTIGRQDEVNFMYKILERFQDRLETLSVNVYTYYEDEDENDEDEDDDDEEEPCVNIELPLLEKLKSLTLSGEEIDMLPHFRQVWPEMVPNLTRLEIKDLQTNKENKIVEWIQGSRFESVKKLKFVPRWFDSDTEKFKSPSKEMIKGIIKSFPNIQKLSLNFDFSDTSALKYLFRYFKHLKKLHLDFEFEEIDSGTGYKMMSLFLGIRFELAAGLADKIVNDLYLPNYNPESIMNLKELCSLTLSTARIFHCSGRRKNPLCLDLISKHGLEKMPKLQKVKLEGGFKILP